MSAPNPGEIEVRDESDSRHWRTEFPNIVYELGLDPFELSLYSHLKRATGARATGKCWKSTATLAAETKMSVGQVSKVKAALCKKQPMLGGKPLIRIAKEKRVGGQKPKDIMTLTDIWAENFAHFYKAKPCSPHEHESSNDVHPMNMDVHPMNVPCSPGEIKKEQIEERTNEEEEEERAKQIETNSAAAAIWNREEKKEIAAVLCKVCDLTPTALSPKDRGAINNLLIFLRTQMQGENGRAAAAEIERRFGAEVWSKPNNRAPWLSQISTDWVKQGRAADCAKPDLSDFQAQREAYKVERDAKRRAGG